MPIDWLGEMNEYLEQYKLQTYLERKKEPDIPYYLF